MRFKKNRRSAASDPAEPPHAEKRTVECERCEQPVPLAEAVFVTWPDGDDMWACVRCVPVLITFHTGASVSGPIGTEGDI